MKETERKFILKELPKLYVDSVYIEQGYLMLAQGKQLRIRLVDRQQAFICYKSDISVTERNEYEYEVPISDGIELYDSCKAKLRKDRYKTDYNGNSVDIDIYPDLDIAVVEIEYDTELKESDIPSYCGEEITGKREWSNVQLAFLSRI